MDRLVLYRVLVAVGFIAGLGIASTVASQRTAASMAGAAETFISTLSSEQRQAAALAFDSDDRERFHYIPVEMFPRLGLKIEDMNGRQRQAAHELLESGLSQVGFAAAVDIMELETVLGILEQNNGRMNRNPEWYFFSVFGEPSPRGTWGWRVEGHHLSVHFTVVDGEVVASAPSFFGSNPAEVPEGPKKGMRVLARVEDTARALLSALSESQRTVAVLADVAPNDIATEAFAMVHPLGPGGIRASDLTSGQRGMLMEVIDAYTSMMADDLAAQRMAKLEEAGIGDITFAWAGQAERGGKHYYRVQGPTFLIEYDNIQNEGNHVHSVWRDFTGDFGRDVLREHLQAKHQRRRPRHAAGVGVSAVPTSFNELEDSVGSVDLKRLRSD